MVIMYFPPKALETALCRPSRISWALLTYGFCDGTWIGKRVLAGQDWLLMLHDVGGRGDHSVLVLQNRHSLVGWTKLTALGDGLTAIFRRG